ncbi:MAG: MFS transporter [Planctomycetota bacterium]|nr:MFS transporter [Planctomycetota bacterium]
MSTASPTRTLLVVSLLHGATHLYTIFLSPLNPELQAYFGLTGDREVAVFQTVYLIVYAASNLVAGLLSARYSPRLLLTLMPLINGAGVMGMALLGHGHYAGMCVLTALGACGGGLYHPVANLLLTETFPHQKGRALGISGIGASLAFTLGPWTSGALVHELGWSWQHVALLFGALGPLCAALAWLFVPAARGQAVARGDAKEGPEAGVCASLRSVLVFAVFAMLVMGGREIISWGAANSTSLFLKNVHGSNDSGFLIAMIFAPGLVVQPLAGRWSDTLGRERVLFGSMLVLGVALYAIPRTPLAWLALPYAVLGAALLATIPTFEALVADRSPVSMRGLIFGIVITAGIGLGSLGPYAVGLIADAGHQTPEAYRNAFAALAVLAAVCAALTLALKPVARRLGLVASLQPAAPQPGLAAD